MSLDASHGYVTDVGYVGTFFPELAPAWLDHVAIVHGIAPPSRNPGLCWCDVGCGVGYTATILAATHPAGQFVGIDFMASHIDQARQFAADACVDNVVFHHTDVTEDGELDLPQFDYIVAHGIYSWVDAQTKQALRSFIDRFLKPGGLVYVSYNALPGRGADVAFQRLLRTIAHSGTGDSIHRMDAAMTVIRRLAEQHPPALDGGFSRLLQTTTLDGNRARYFAHELLAEHWDPLFVTDVRAAMATIALTPVGSASLIQNYDSYVLRADARQTLALVEGDDARELARDFLLDTRFRRDVFVRSGQPLGENARRDKVLGSTFSLSRPAVEVEYAVPTPAGALRFDNPHARHIVAALANGPRTLAHIVPEERNVVELVANMLVLCAAGMARPAEGAEATVTTLNEAIRRRLDGPDELLHLALSCGTAVAVPRALLRQLRGGSVLNDSQRAWHDFLLIDSSTG